MLLSGHPILFQLFLWTKTIVRRFSCNFLLGCFPLKCFSDNADQIIWYKFVFLTSQHNTLSHHINTCCFLWTCKGDDVAHFSDNTADIQLTWFYLTEKELVKLVAKICLTYSNHGKDYSCYLHLECCAETDNVTVEQNSDEVASSSSALWTWIETLYLMITPQQYRKLDVYIVNMVNISAALIY